MYPSTPIHPLLSEAGLIPAKIMLDRRQKAYAYRLLTFPDCHPTKQVLPVSLGKGDENSQPGEQPDDTLMWVENSKPRLFGHLLTQQIASNNAIDLADGVEPVKAFGPASGFSGSIIIDEKKALQEAKKCQTGTVMWADGSKLDQGNVGAAVCWKDRDLNSWKNKEILDAELRAIAESLEIARKTTLNTHNTPITIFSDSREALTEIRKLSSYIGSPYMRSLIYQRTHDLRENGHSVSTKAYSVMITPPIPELLQIRDLNRTSIAP